MRSEMRPVLLFYCQHSLGIGHLTRSFALATALADRLLTKGIYVIGFSYPVVPHGQARIRTQVSAAHDPDDLIRAAALFAESRAELLA